MEVANLTTVTPRPNRDALANVIDIYRDAMRLFVARQLRRAPGSTVDSAVRAALRDRRVDEVNEKLRQGSKIEEVIDVNDFPYIVQRHWREAFSEALGADRTIQNELWLISSARNQVSHPGTQDLDAGYAGTNIYHIANVLGRINAPEQKKAVEDIYATVMKHSTSQDDSATKDSAGSDGSTGTNQQQKPEQPRPLSNLKPWREVIRPNQDVAQGSYQQAEFAADLQQVHDGRADATQYGNPVDFYDHTYITPGIRTLLVNALKRLAGRGGDPVIQTKTGFGGGKTHSLIALYHLVRNADALLHPREGRDSRVSKEIWSIMEEAGYDEPPDSLGKVAVLDGMSLSVTDSAKKTEGDDPLNTLWGEMAYQLGDQEAYDIIGDAARQGLAPGGRQLDALFSHIGPCVILIDELVAYVRNAGTAQDNIYTFIQALTQSVRRASNVSLVVTLPQTQAEAGGSVGAESLELLGGIFRHREVDDSETQASIRLDSLMGRIEAVWEPLAVNEAFEVVRRRLFDEVSDTGARDRTCEAFARMYSNDRARYPEGVTELNYLERMKACYPIHPEIFDRLYSDWSSVPGFQRTRGVLRMMANCVGRLYLNNDASPMILPGNLPFSDGGFAGEFNRLLPGEWGPVFTEVDSDNSRTDNIDKSSQRFSEVGGAARRVARTVFLGSARSGATRGIDSRQVHLGVAQPGHGYARYDEALAQMTGNLYYLYQEVGRYYFHVEENLNKVANDRADVLERRTIDDYIAQKMEEARHRRADIVLYSNNSDDIADADTVRLVALPPGLALASRSSESDDATPEASEIMKNRGDAPRIHRNTLLFLAAKQDDVRNLRDEARRYLAWDSIINGDAKIQNLTGNRLGQARTEVTSGDRRVEESLVRAYRWILNPSQPDPRQGEYSVNQLQTKATSTGDIFKSAFDKAIEDEALVERISPASLTNMLQEYVWSRESAGEHIGTDELWDLFTCNVYLPRLRSRSVLDVCIAEGVEQGSFGYADAYNDGAYERLRIGEPIAHGGVIGESRAGFLVRPEAAGAQKEKDKEKEIEKPPTAGGPVVYCPEGGKPPVNGTRLPHTSRTRRVVVTRTTAGPDLSMDAISDLRGEIIRNLSSDGGEVTVEIKISASKSDGFSEEALRAVRENSVQLGLEFTEEEQG